jgi:hypothetical protein
MPILGLVAAPLARQPRWPVTVPPVVRAAVAVVVAVVSLVVPVALVATAWS